VGASPPAPETGPSRASTPVSGASPTSALEVLRCGHCRAVHPSLSGTPRGTAATGVASGHAAATAVTAGRVRTGSTRRRPCRRTRRPGPGPSPATGLTRTGRRGAGSTTRTGNRHGRPSPIRPGRSRPARPGRRTPDPAGTRRHRPTGSGRRRCSPSARPPGPDVLRDEGLVRATGGPDARAVPPTVTATAPAGTTGSARTAAPAGGTAAAPRGAASAGRCAPAAATALAVPAVRASLAVRDRPADPAARLPGQPGRAAHPPRFGALRRHRRPVPAQPGARTRPGRAVRPLPRVGPPTRAALTRLPVGGGSPGHRGRPAGRCSAGRPRGVRPGRRRHPRGRDGAEGRRSPRPRTGPPPWWVSSRSGSGRRWPCCPGEEPGAGSGGRRSRNGGRDTDQDGGRDTGREADRGRCVSGGAGRDRGDARRRTVARGAGARRRAARSGYANTP